MRASSLFVGFAVWLAAMSTAPTVMAEPISADFAMSAGFYSATPCKGLGASGRAIGAGSELTLADSPSGGCFGALGVDWDPTTNLLTVIGVQGGAPGSTGANYPFIDVSIDNIIFGIIGEQISGITQLSQNLFTAVDGSTRFDPLAALSFTANSLDFNWFVTPGNNFQQMSILQNGTAVFQVTTIGTTSVPEPASVSLFALGIAAAAVGRRRRNISA